MCSFKSLQPRISLPNPRKIWCELTTFFFYKFSASTFRRIGRSKIEMIMSKSIYFRFLVQLSCICGQISCHPSKRWITAFVFVGHTSCTPPNFSIFKKILSMCHQIMKYTFVKLPFWGIKLYIKNILRAFI